MCSIPRPEDELRRIEALQRYDVDGTGPEQVYDDITVLAAKVLNAPIAALAFIDSDRQWFKSCYGAHLQPVSRDESLCGYTILNPIEATVFEDTLRDPRSKGAAVVKNAPFIRSYAGAPLITPDFQAIGALSVLDVQPRVFTIEQMELLRTLARQVVNQLELRRQTILLSSANEKLLALASSDGLTGLKNHRAFRDHLEDELLFAIRKQAALSVILLDVDDFKDYNDQYGHPAGDEVLKAVAIMLLESSREYDMVARYGGEEFTVVLRGAGISEASAVAERLRERIASAAWPARRITASMGVATFTPNIRSSDAMIDEADRLLYQAKRCGKNRVCSSQPDALFDPAQWDALTLRQQRRNDQQLEGFSIKASPGA